MRFATLITIVTVVVPLTKLTGAETNRTVVPTVTIGTLLAHKETYKGKKVEVEGYYMGSFESYRLYESKSNRSRTEHLWVDIFRTAPGLKVVTNFKISEGAGKVRIIGTFDYRPKGMGVGHLGSSPAQITNIELFESTEPAIKPSPEKNSFGSIPSFIMDGREVQKEFNLGPSREITTNLYLFTFIYTNDWWRIIVKPEDPTSEQYMGTASGYLATTLDCMRVPDGIRLFLDSNDPLTRDNPKTALVCPFPFPPPGQNTAFSVWIALHPKPDLPVIKENKMHRFIIFPSCQAPLMYHPKNLGSFAANYLNTENGNFFLEQLNIYNNGIRVVFGEGENEFKRYSAPFHNGFLEMEVSAIKNTNLNGLKMPLESKVQFYSPKDTNAKSSNDVEVLLTTEIYVTSIQLFSEDVAVPIPTSPPMTALDYRSPLLPSDREFAYSITNDTWKSVTNKEIQFWAKLKKMGIDQEQKGLKRYYITFLQYWEKFKKIVIDQEQNSGRIFYLAFLSLIVMPFVFVCIKRYSNVHRR